MIGCRCEYDENMRVHKALSVELADEYESIDDDKHGCVVPRGEGVYLTVVVNSPSVL